MNLIFKFSSFFLTLLIISCSSNKQKELLPNSLYTITETAVLQPVWKVQVGNSSNNYLNLNPVKIGDFLVVASSEGRITMLDSTTGKPLWLKNVREGIVGGVGASENNIAVSTINGNIILFDLKGNEIWKSFVGREVLSKAIFHNNLVYIQTQDDQIIALNLQNGDVVWSYKEMQPSLTLYGTASPIIYKNSLIVAFSNGKIISFSLDGKTIWEKQISIPLGNTELAQMVDIKSDLIIQDGILYSVGYQGKLIAMNPMNGNTVWQHSFSANNNLLYAENFIYVVDVDAQITKVDSKNSSIIWTTGDLLRRQLSAAQKTNLNYIAVGDYQGYLHLINKDTGKISSRVKVSNNAIHIQPIFQNNFVIVYEDSGFLYAFEILEK